MNILEGGLAWHKDESRTKKGTGAAINDINHERSMSISLGGHSMVFQDEVWATDEGT